MGADHSPHPVHRGLVAEARAPVERPSLIGGEETDESVSTGQGPHLFEQSLGDALPQPVTMVIGVDGGVLKVEVARAVADSAAHPDDLAAAADGDDSAPGRDQGDWDGVPSERVLPADADGQTTVFVGCGTRSINS